MNKRLPPEALAYYLNLGASRSYQAVADHFGVSKRTVTAAAARERWQAQLEQAERKSREQIRSSKRCARRTSGSRRIRIGSALALDVEDIDLDGGVLHLREFKGDRVERVYFGAAVRDHLVGFLAHRPRTGPLFAGPQGLRLTKRSAQRRVTQWLERVEIDATVHSLRHTFATRFLRKTGDLFLTQRAMRHRSVASTVVYLSLDEQRLKAAMQ
jgi:integrase